MNIILYNYVEIILSIKSYVDKLIDICSIKIINIRFNRQNIPESFSVIHHLACKT